MKTTLRRKHRIKREKLERCYYNIVSQEVFWDFLYKRGHLDAFISRAWKHRGVLKKYYKLLNENYLDPRYNNYRDRRKSYSIVFLQPDLRNGEETYGYDSVESIEGDLNYISDRFSSAFRIRWILDLLEKNVKNIGHSNKTMYNKSIVERVLGKGGYNNKKI